MKPKIDYEFEDNEFEVWVEYETATRKHKFCIFVDGDLFYDWLFETSRLEWEINYPDHTGTHIQKVGMYESLAQYLDEMPRSTVGEDLFLYINTNTTR